ncbi:MAG TPA: GMC oxidoreductase [Dongiaceae bacterium]|nr:GMC oxidoreductase [Dongiaceae bacterium]
MPQKVVIVGAGLAGSILAAELAQTFDVTVVELAQQNGNLAVPLTDLSQPAGLSPHVGSGPGGTSALWNNGLIELEDDDYASWPISRQELLPYVARAYPLLSGVSREAVTSCYDELRQIHVDRGIPQEMIGNGLFYPQRRRNLWQSLRLAERPIRFITGRARRLLIDNGRVTGLVFEDDVGRPHQISADHVILSAGGLSTPLVVQATEKAFSLSSLEAAGRHYIDHPMGMIAKVKLQSRFYDIWNFRQRRIAGALQTPIVIRDQSGLKISVFLRPASVVSHGDRRDRVQSVLVNLRNAPFKLSALAALAGSRDDIRDLLSFKLGLQLPTDYYVLRLVASEVPDTHRSVYRDEKTDGIVRDWRITEGYLEKLSSLLQQLLDKLGGIVVESRFFDQWGKNLHSAAHHSGTCRMSQSEEDGVCDSTCQIFGISNAYICDGSTLPSTGYANTGLTIAALALRLSDHLKQQAA